MVNTSLPPTTRDPLEEVVLSPMRDHIIETEVVPRRMIGTSLERWLNNAEQIIVPHRSGLIVQVLPTAERIEVFTLGTDCSDPRDFFKYSRQLDKATRLFSIALLTDGQVLLSLGQPIQIWGFDRPAFTPSFDEFNNIYYWANRAVLLTTPSQLDSLEFETKLVVPR